MVLFFQKWIGFFFGGKKMFGGKLIYRICWMLFFCDFWGWEFLRFPADVSRGWV